MTGDGGSLTFCEERKLNARVSFTCEVSARRLPKIMLKLNVSPDEIQRDRAAHLIACTLYGIIYHYLQITVMFISIKHDNAESIGCVSLHRLRNMRYVAHVDLSLNRQLARCMYRIHFPTKFLKQQVHLLSSPRDPLLCLS